MALTGSSSNPGRVIPHPYHPFITAPPDTILKTGEQPRYQFDDNDLYYTGPDVPNDLYLRNPSNVKTDVRYDPVTKEYIFENKIGNMWYRYPHYMSAEEYQQFDQKRAVRSYWSERIKASASNAKGAGGLIPQLNIGGQAFEQIFGSSTIDIRPQGSAELTFGVLANRRDDPSLNVRQRKTVNFDFNQKIQLSVIAKIGDKIEFQTNYNTEATFEFENKLKLKYEGKEDEILQLIEAGNVTLPLNSTLITGSQSLFGIKTKLKFGRAMVTAVYSEQQSEASNITVQGGAQANYFTLTTDQYEERKHFLMGQYFRDNFDTALSTLPIIRSNINIIKLEVWVTNIGAAVNDNRNLVAFQDLGEYNPYNPLIHRGTSYFPSGRFSNDLLNQVLADAAMVRNINTVTNYLSGPGFNFVQGVDYEKVESARKLSTTEYTFNPKLGFISLNTTLNSDQVLAVAYQYNVIGDTTVFQVGEFSDQGIDAPNCLVVKLLKSASQNTKIPLWDLMMKNVYPIGAYQVNREDFILNILYSGNDNGVPTGYLTNAGTISGLPLIQVMNLDNLDPLLNPPADGMFDFIDNAATQGGTIQSNNGRIFFTVLEPFGSHLRKKIGNTTIANKYCYDSLYSMTKNGAQQYPEKNKYIIEGFYKSSSGSEISLNAINVPQGSVKVTAGGIPLVENVDYTVDYTLGRVRIINEGVLNSGTPINVSLENQSMFNLQTKRLMGAHVDYKINKDFNIGATLLNLRERPLTQKVNYGDDPISNTIWGMDVQYQTSSPFITKMVDKLPFYSTKAESKIQVEGEFAHFLPGHSKAIGKSGTSYIDDFEGSKSTIDLKNWSTWFLASTPQLQTSFDMFPEARVGTDLAYGFNRAKLAWYIIDPLFYDRQGNLRPPNVDQNEISSPYVRQVLETEVFPNKDLPNGIPTNIGVFNLAYYPNERGPYNYDVNPTIYSKGLNPDGTLADPESRWGGIMRKIESTDFDATNVEYIEFWMMDPFITNQQNDGYLYFNFGDISEDILRDGRKSFENGLPATAEVIDVDTTIWGRVPRLQALVESFSNEPGSRQYQDVGYDGLGDDDEALFFAAKYLEKIANDPNLGPQSAAYQKALEDISADNYHYFRGGDYDADPDYSSVLERYKKFNGTEKNSPTDDQNPEVYPTSATNYPNVEDINRDNTLSESERYFQYKVKLDPNEMVVGKNYINDAYHATGIALPNGTVGDCWWYQFKVPITSPEKVVGNIQDFQSIRFMRMFMKGFSDPMVLRFATLELVRGEWRKYRYSLLAPGEYIPNDIQNETVFDVSAVNIEENGLRIPIPYVIPPGIQREINVGTTNLQQLNEQSMVIKVCNLVDGDARGAYKTTDFDFRQYKHLQMFVHAEKSREEDVLETGDLTLFVRFGSDLTNNYYEYEVPLEFTDWYTTGNNPEAIWPAANEVNIDLERLVDYKLQRNIDMRDPNSVVSLLTPYYVFEANKRITILGTPSISEIKAMMIGIRNPKKLSLTDSDDGEPKCAEIWVNELRLSEFNNKSAFAATARVRANLADLGNVTVSGLYSSPGFGSIEKKVNERSKETNATLDFSTNLELGKFFPENLGLKIPMHFDVSQTRLTPEYNPLDPDIKMKDDLRTLDSENDRDSLRSLTEDYTMRKNLNFVNVRKDRVGATGKIYPWNIENFDVTYSYSELFNRNIDISYYMKKVYKGGLGYNYSTNPKNYKPFTKVKFLNKKAFALIRDFNFYLLPKMFSLRHDMNREYSERMMRNKSKGDVIMIPTFVKKWDWNRQYDFKFDLATSLRLEYSAIVGSYIQEPPGQIDKNDPEWDAYKKQINNELSRFGTKNRYNQNFSLNYNIPINKLPLIDFITSTARYQSTYTWTASPVSIQKQLGNSIENSYTFQLNGNVDFDKIYTKIPGVNKLIKPGKKAPQKGPGMPGRDKEKDKTQPPKPEPKKDTTQKPPSVMKYFAEAGKVVTKLIFGFKRASLSYSEGNGTLMPGFMPEPSFLGNDWNLSAPGVPFIFGYQSDIRQEAVLNSWLTGDSLLNNPYITKYNTNLNARGTYEPFPDFKIELSAERTYSITHQEYFKSDGYGNFSSSSPTDRGNFSMSFFSLPTAFIKDGDANTNENFEAMKKNRYDIAMRLARENPNWSGQYNDTTGFPVGYGPTSTEVLIPSFISAYAGKPASGVKLALFPKIPAVNWRFTYNGLSKIPFFKKFLKNLTITHGYRSSYSIGSFTSDILYREINGFASTYDESNNFIPEFQIAQVSITEQFAPLITFDMTWNNSLMSKFELKRARNLSLSFVGNQLTEVSSNEMVIGLGYRFKDIKFILISVGGTGSRQNMKSDLNVKADFSIRSNKTIIRRLVEDVNQISSGQKVMTINLSADYMVSDRVNIRLFYDQTINNPYVSSQFRNSTTNSGISLRFTLAQ